MLRSLSLVSVLLVLWYAPKPGDCQNSRERYPLVPRFRRLQANSVPVVPIVSPFLLGGPLRNASGTLYRIVRLSRGQARRPMSRARARLVRRRMAARLRRLGAMQSGAGMTTRNMGRTMDFIMPAVSNTRTLSNTRTGVKRITGRTTSSSKPRAQLRKKGTRTPRLLVSKARSSGSSDMAKKRIDDGQQLDGDGRRNTGARNEGEKVGNLLRISSEPSSVGNGTVSAWEERESEESVSEVGSPDVTTVRL